MSEISLPIYVIEGQDVGVYLSVEKAERHLEAIDVRSQIYVGFDARGQPLLIRSEANDVRIAIDGEKDPDPDALAAILRRYLIRVGEPEASALTDRLDLLVQLSQKYAV